MNKLHGVLALALALFATTGCSRNRSSDHGAPVAVSAPAAGSGVADGAPLAAGRALTVTMEVGLTVADVEDARATVRREVARAGGYVADASSFASSGSERSVRMVLRIPAAQIAGVHGSLAHVGQITSDVEKVEDVTEQRADLDARLSNARASEKRVLEIMGTKAGSVADVLEAEKEVSRIRESIERMEAQKRALEGRIELATLTVTLTAQPAPAAWQTPGESIATAAHEGVRGAQATAVYGAIVFVTVAPVVLPVVALVAAITLLLRARRRRHAELAAD